MIVKPNWDMFKAKFNENPEDNFEFFSYLLFCKEFEQDKGITRYLNQPAIETEPINKENEVIGWQAKFYNKPLSKYETVLLETLNKAKRDYPKLTKIIFYTNTEWTLNYKDKGTKADKTKVQMRIENLAEDLELEIVWRTASYFESPFVANDNSKIARHFFMNENHIDFFVQELKQKNDEIDGLKIQLENSSSEQEKLRLSEQINTLKNERDKSEKKVISLEEKLAEYSNDVELVNEINKILHLKGISEALEYIEQIDFEKDMEKNIENSKALLIQANLYNIQNEHKKTDKAYQQSIAFNRNYQNSFEYANYLITLHKNKEAIKQLKLMELDIEMTKSEEGTVYNSFGLIYQQERNLDEAKSAFEKSVIINRLLVEEDFEKYCVPLSLAIKNLANVISNNNSDSAESLYLEALEILNNSKEMNEYKKNYNLGMIFYNLAVLYSKVDVFKSEYFFIKFLDLYLKIIKENNNETNMNTLASIYNAIASLYSQEIYFSSNNNFKEKLDEIEPLYLNSLKIFRKLAEANPLKYNFRLGMILTNLVRLYESLDRKEESIAVYNEAFKIRKKLFEYNNKSFGIEYADILITGVYLNRLSKDNLNIAESILANFSSITRAKVLLDHIKEQKTE